MKKIFATRNFPVSVDTGLLFLRLVCGIAMAQHGFGKIQNPMGWMGPDAAVPGFLQLLAAVSEFGGGIAWAIGLLTPLASFGIACTMAVAVYMHAIVMGDPFVAKGPGGGSYELAAIFFTVAVLLVTASPGRFSIDRIIFGTK